MGSTGVLSYRRSKNLHVFCRNCGRKSMHIRTNRCSSCGFNRKK